MKPPPDDPRWPAALGICARLRAAGHRALLAGGCVRDGILGVLPKDYDVATDARPEDVARLFRKCVGVGAAYGVQMVVLPEGSFEVTTFRSDGPYSDGRHPDYVEFRDEIADARRRDFTVNALFYDPVSNTVLDYVEGQQDMRDKRLRTVGNPKRRFAEDRLRLLRAVRFAARLGYTIDPDTARAIRETAPLVCWTSAERIRDEIVKMLTEGHAREAFASLDELGLLEHVLPEVARMKGVEQPPAFHPEGDVFQHTLGMLGLMNNPSPEFAMAVLLHDVGKPQTQTFTDRIRFNYHDKAGAALAKNLCERLRFSNASTEHIVNLVLNHMRLDAAPSMRPCRLKRFVREPWFPDLVELCRLDCLASHGALDTIEWVERYLVEMPPDALKPPPLIRGDDLIEMGYTPGPLFSTILRAVEDEQLEGRLRDRGEAWAFVRARWPRQDSSEAL
ncbi:MAG TPA: CCA tRNA nucleotidyltransferase [Candidatus Hydrogenedentes bacterium]|nr:CCA tRNA nucleotidyltransferase [Candidatus Hydrogenedentota bacterium]HRT21257.1 CCA tRNA nucleotidyltransferase [Candidatus Hydrogenedentota bacterium]HRT65119.1 CCA tRNA nucleotidyltransferase [Candidatus Hydrogenedentota bacterium]